MNSNQTFPRLCRVLEIYEADFGCEERPDGQETMVCVRLLDTTENAKTLRASRIHDTHRGSGTL